MPSGGTTSKGPSWRALVWLEESQSALVRQIGEVARMRVTACGCPGRGRSASVAESLGAEGFTDLRHALTSAEVDVALFATAAGEEGKGPSPLDDAETLRIAGERGVALVSLEPSPSSVVMSRRVTKALTGVGRAEGSAIVKFVPSTRRTKGFRAAREVLEAVGPARTVSISQRSGLGQGSLSAKLYDAMLTLLVLQGEPEVIDAANSGPDTSGGVHLAPGENLRTLRGDMTANLRFGSGRSASIVLSESAGRWFRGVTVISRGGCVRLDDKSFEVIDQTGRTTDRSRTRLTTGGREDPDATPEAGGAQAMGEQIAAILEGRAESESAVERETALAMCEAALLSARTGQGESPATILRMAGG
ncbi:MAG: hypothetical protein AB7G17_06820 [Phycisphaerales bacterium]